MSKKTNIPEDDDLNEIHVSHYKKYTKSHLKYQKSEKGIAARKKYQESEKGILSRRKSQEKQKIRKAKAMNLLRESEEKQK